MVPEFSMINELGQYPSIEKIRYPKAGETNPTLKIGFIRIKGAGRKWVEGANVDYDYLPWMEWVNEEKVPFLKMDRSRRTGICMLQIVLPEDLKKVYQNPTRMAGLRIMNKYDF
ncbi:hypothetical protein Ct9H90mP29_13890 [bacterium]|nr:MAG: hypothetical protein Ct9H90mP29_13890 [bacterium]